MSTLTDVMGDPSLIKTPRLYGFVERSRLLGLAWTALRIWLGVMWLQAGVAKLWGAENPVFLHHHGAGVKGFAAHGTAAYGWWASFLHSFVVPNSSWIGVLVAVSEFAIGIALCLGLFTRLACLGSLVLLFTYVMSGTASVCALYAVAALVVLATWRTSSWLGADGFIRARRSHPTGGTLPVTSDFVPAVDAPLISVGALAPVRAVAVDDSTVVR